MNHDIDFDGDFDITSKHDTSRPPQQTVDFAVDAEEKLRLAWLRKNKKTGEKGSVASTSELAAMFMNAEPINEATSQQVSAEVSAELDDFFAEFNSEIAFKSESNADVNGAKITEKYELQTEPKPSDAFKNLDDFLN